MLTLRCLNFVLGTAAILMLSLGCKARRPASDASESEVKGGLISSNLGPLQNANHLKCPVEQQQICWIWYYYHPILGNNIEPNQPTLNLDMLNVQYTKAMVNAFTEPKACSAAECREMALGYLNGGVYIARYGTQASLVPTLAVQWEFNDSNFNDSSGFECSPKLTPAEIQQVEGKSWWGSCKK